MKVWAWAIMVHLWILAPLLLIITTILIVLLLVAVLVVALLRLIASLVVLLGVIPVVPVLWPSRSESSSTSPCA